MPPEHIDAPPANHHRREADGSAEIVTHVGALRRYARALVGNPSDADDLVQECLTRVLAQMRAWREVRDVRAYMFTTLHNVFIDNGRRKRSAGGEVPIDDVVGHLVSPPTQGIRLEVRDMVDALGQLPREQREVVLLVGVEGMSYVEAANVIGVPIGTVMSRLSRGREALRQLTTLGRTTRLRVVK
jgi:RNA polymerase sigma-70 factor, ECF subfamily